MLAAVHVINCCPGCIQSPALIFVLRITETNKMSEICFILHLLVEISLFFFFFLCCCGRERRTRPLARPFVPTLGLSCWISLHADPSLPPSRRPDTDPGVDIEPQHLYSCVWPRNSPDFQIRSLYFAVAPSEASSAATLTGEKAGILLLSRLSPYLTHL